MRRILLALMSTLAVVVMLFGYRTSNSNPASAATATVAAGTNGGGSTTGATTSTTPASPQPSTSSSTATQTVTKTVTGQTVQTRWGPVQVPLTVASKKITAVTVLQSPTGNGRDIEINSAALPILKQETLQAQNAKIDSVSGATYTSNGYVTSLQSAVVQAGR